MFYKAYIYILWYIYVWYIYGYIPNILGRVSMGEEIEMGIVEVKGNKQVKQTGDHVRMDDGVL